MKKNFKLLLIPALVFSCVLCITAETAKAQPPNDLCADAIGPLAVPSTTAGTTVGATIDNAVAPFCVTAVTSPGVWYTVMGTGNTMTVSTCNDATYDNKISVYCADCASLTCVDGNDDAIGCGLTAKLSFCSIEGGKYKVLVHGFGGATGTFNLTITDDGNPCAGAVDCSEPATVTTQAVTNIGDTTATGNGNITDLGAPYPTAHGVCWNTTGTPTLADNSTDEGATSSTGAFTSTMTGLSPNTTYYLRAYATNTTGTAYGDVVSFTTQKTPPPPDSDNDGLPDSEEQGPDGDNPTYDGNGDGISDWQQGNVGSFHSYAHDGSSHYITLEVPSGQRIENPYAKRTFDTPPPAWVSLPYGFFSFTITGLEEGGTTTMTIYLDGEPPQTYYKYGKTPDNPVDHWYEFSYDGETGAEKVGTTIVLHFVDGLRGDHDLMANGKITDPGGPAAIETHEVLYFPYITTAGGEQTELGIINTENYTATSTISYYREEGDLITSTTITLGPKGKTTIFSDNIPSSSASAVLSADGYLLGYTRYVNSNGQRCAWPASTKTQKSLPVPHIAIDTNWATALSLFNPSDEDVEVTLDYDTGTSGNLTLNAKSRSFFWLTQAEPVSSIDSTGYISAMEMFNSLTSGGDMAALLLKPIFQVSHRCLHYITT